MNELYDVGGITLPRPFKIRRLGHFGFNVNDLEKSVDFYSRILGFRVTDILDATTVLPDVAGKMRDPRLFFFTHNADHHAFLLADRSLGAIFGDDAVSADITLNQITWQVGTLDEVVGANAYFAKHGIEIRRSGRDMPGSNWHVYVRDPDGHTIELYYGMEQIGWDGRSKPADLYYRRFEETPPLPQISEQTEVEEASKKGIDILSGFVVKDTGEPRFNVGGVMLPRPFKITGIGPISLFVADLAASERFYTQRYGFVVTEDVTWNGHRCIFLRHGTEHHSLRLLPREARSALGLSSHTTCASVGLQLGSYRQLRDAISFLKDQGARFIELPPELSSGIDYAAHILDHDGHCLELYYYMENVGWDGKPRPAAQRRKVGKDWPASLEPLSDTYIAQTFQGPIG